MERIQVLIDKLASQQRAGESADKLLITVQLLQAELLNCSKDEAPSFRRVAVIMPGVTAINLPAQEPTIVSDTTPPPRSFFAIPDSDKRFLPAEPVMPPAPSYKELLQDAEVNKEPYTLRKPLQTVAPSIVEEPKEVFHLDDLPYDEAPTLVQHVPSEKEVHEIIAEKGESLNDRLKAGTTEVAQRLSGEPIKDLRKGIALNDKFVFINELFRGDEAMYERSIKTINSFHILPEAEYWMNRELKVKLGWSDNKDIVQHFYGVVRRRFS